VLVRACSPFRTCIDSGIDGNAFIIGALRATFGIVLTAEHAAIQFVVCQLRRLDQRDDVINSQISGRASGHLAER
jgi:hypothetical protein